MKEHWIDPRDAEFLAKLKRLKKEGREAQISDDTSQRSVKISSGTYKFMKENKTDAVLIFRRGRFPWSRDRRVSTNSLDKEEDKEV